MRSLVRFQLAPRESAQAFVARPRDRWACRGGAAAARQWRGAATGRRLARAQRTGPAVVRAVVVGIGAVGARAARQLLSSTDVDDLVVVDIDGARAAAAAASFGDVARVSDDSSIAFEQSDVVILSAPAGHRAIAERAIERGADVVSTSVDCAE